MANRTNFVKVSNLPPGYSNAMEMFSMFSSCGLIQDMTAVDATTVIISYSMRSGAENAAFAMSGVTLGGSTVTVSLYHTHTDPQFLSNPAYQGLGQYIGQDHHVMNPTTFQPWGAPPQPQSAVIRPPVLNIPNSNTPGFGFLNQLLGSVGYSYGGPAPPQPAVPLPGTSQHMHGGAGGGRGGGSGFGVAVGGMIAGGIAGGATIGGAITGGGGIIAGGATGGGAITGGGGATGGGGVPKDILATYTTPWVEPAPQPGDPPQCSICLLDLGDSSSYSTDTTLAPVLTLVHCNHSFHSACLTALLANSPSPFLQCPTCKKVYGVRTGTRPSTGTMSHRILNTPLPGHSGCDTIEMTFMFTPGIQGQEHPHPGQYYNPVGFPRTAFLPDNQEGLKALHGLYLAWEQRLLFTVGRSITTGQDNCVTWNDIHLKTKRGGGEHAYPDEHYLSNLSQDLAGFGITEAEISSHMDRHQGLRDRGHL